MAAIYALEGLFDLLKREIEASFGSSVVVEWGQSRIPVKLNQGTVGRVLVVPGGPDGAFGSLGGAKQWPHPAPALLDLGQLFSVYCYGHDPGQRQEDRKQDRVALRVLHETIRQLFNVSHGDQGTSPVDIGDPKLLKPMSGSVLGREFLLVCTIEQPILDMFDDSPLLTDVSPGTATITTEFGNRSETSTTAETPENAS